MNNNSEKITNRQLVAYKIDDIKGQLEEIESLIHDIELTPNDHNFSSNIHALKLNLDFFFSNWERGTARDMD